MSLITPAEVSSIAFVNALDPALILPEFIASAQAKYIVPVVTQALIDKIEATPSEYTELVDEYIKPYLAFCVKYMFYNQLLTETQLFPTSDDQREAAIQEIINMMLIKKALLIAYLQSHIFNPPFNWEEEEIINGFLLDPGEDPVTTGSPISEALASASSAIIDDPDTINFIQFTTGLLRKISWATLKALLYEYFLIAFYDLRLSDISFEFRDITPGTAQTYTLDIAAGAGYKILTAALETDDGSLTGVAVKIDNTAVTSLSDITVGTEVDLSTATGENQVVSGCRITITTSSTYTGSPSLLRGKLNILKL